MSEIEKVIKEVVKLNCGDYDCILPENEIDNTDFYGGKSGSCKKCKYNIILQALQEKLEREEGFEFESSRRDSEERCKHRCCNICDRLRQEKAEREKGPSGWIAVTERLPDEHECVLFVEKHSRLVNYGFYEKIDRDKPFVKEFPDGRKICFEKPDGGVWWRFRFGDGLERRNVTHWMPLPEPSKERFKQ